MFMEKKVIQEKSKYTNLIENLNSQMRDKISYLVRKTKAYAKSFTWLNQRLAMFFVELNFKGYKNLFIQCQIFLLQFQKILFVIV